MICEGSCDTGDWNNDVKNFSFDHKNKLYLKIIFYIKILK